MESHILHTRDGESSGASLSPGAIAGIACGAGGLFLAAALLFFIYWRRDRQFDRAENFYQTRHGLENTFQPAPGMAPNAVSYTMDYKMDSQQKEYDGSSYTYSPDKPTYPFSPLSVSDGGVGASSAMPTHPAYIPRAFVRGVSSSNHSRTTSASTHHQHLTNNTISSSPHFPNNNNNTNLNPNDMVVQAYLDAASGERVPSAVLLAASSSPPSGSSPSFTHQDKLPTSTDSSLATGLPIQKPRPAATLPTQIIPSQITPLPSQTSPGYYSSTTSTSSSANNSNNNSNPARKPRQYIPPRLNLVGGPATSHTAIPLKGKENSTISGPLAFPEHYRRPSRKTTTPSKKERRRTLFAEDDDELSETDHDDHDGDRDDDRYDDDQQIISDSEDDEYYNDRANKRRQQQEEREREKNKQKAASGGGVAQPRRQLGMNNNRNYAEIEIGRGSEIW
ncbi:hypothetical protein QBC44DRAFT_321893 [Cladorrhinum sp. PSN332]|nr:hypothetical protein QBC44DRAFT_321893 [Cladorrhinum sp. PSN332]